MTNRDTSRYMNIFKVSTADLERLVATVMDAGAHWCDLYFENSVIRDLTLMDGKVASGGFHIDYGVGIRALDGDRTGYAYSESTDMHDMMSAANAAASIATAGSTRPGKYPKTPSLENCRNSFYPSSGSWDSAPVDELSSALTTLDRMIRAKDSRIVKVTAHITSSGSDLMMYNSLGELVCDSHPLGSVSVTVIFTQNGSNVMKSASRSFCTGPQMLSRSLLSEIAEEVTAKVDESFEARRPKGGAMPVVMGAGASGILLHEAMGHAFEADFVRKGQSIFAGRLGQSICNSGISIVDDGTIPYNRGSLNYDDEGVPGQKTYMVRNGVLESFLHDRISAAHFGVSPTGNGRRESFRCNPIPRMRATYMESGGTDPADIIASVKKGIYVDEFSNGQVKIGEGDFTFFVKGGYLIENGRLTMPVKDINIIGNGPQALADISLVGNDLKIDNGTWTCGKDQSVPVSCGIPTVLINRLTVGGN